MKAKKNPVRRAAKDRKAEGGKICSAVGPTAPEKRFIEDLETRGEAADPTPDGKLPLHATHAVLERNPDGTVKTVKTVRKKLF